MSGEAEEAAFRVIKQGVSDDVLRALLHELWADAYMQGYGEGQYPEDI